MPYEWPLADGTRQRFWAKVDRRGPDECWLWQAFITPQGYGRLRNDRRGASLAHRLAWVIAHGEIPEGLQVLHHCDTPACVNPGHLYLGTNADNVADKVARGRSHAPQPKKRGERHPMAKLTDAQVAEIRRSATGRRGEGKAFAERYGVARSTICIILKRKIRAAA